MVLWLFAKYNIAANKTPQVMGSKKVNPATDPEKPMKFRRNDQKIETMRVEIAQ